MLIQEAMVKGHPSQGILPSGQIAGTISDLPCVADLIASIVSEAEDTLNRLLRPSVIQHQNKKKIVEL